MKLPKKIKIQGFIWTIEQSRDLSTEGACYGSCHYSTQKIFIQPGMTEQKTGEVLLHEIMHACIAQVGLGFRISDGTAKEEEIVTALAHVLYGVLKENKIAFHA